MKRKFIWVVASGLVVIAMLLAACAPAPTTSTTPATPATPAAPATPATPAAPAAPATPATPATPAAWKIPSGRVIPAVKEAIAPGRETAKVTVKKLDGTPVTLTVEKPQYGGTLTKVYGSEILTWDETTDAPWTVSNYIDGVNEMLLGGDWTKGPAGTGETKWQRRGWFDNNYQRGLLAESWEVKDDTTLIFHLRQGIRWQNKPPVNGREFVADDVVYSLRRIYFDTPTSSMAGMAGTGGPTDVYAQDKYTVIVKTRPGFGYTTLDYVAGWTRIFAPEVQKLYGSQNVNKDGVGTGAFIITDYVPQSSATYKRNPNYWGKDLMFPENQEPYLDFIRLVIIPDLSTRLSAMRTGKTDMSGAGASTIPQEQALSLVKTAPQLRYDYYAVCGRHLTMPRLDKNWPSNDIRVRRALMMALDKQTWAESYLGLKGDEIKPVNYPVPASPEWAKAYIPLAELPPSADGFDTKKLYGYYPDEARELMKQAGYPDGFKVEVDFASASVSYGINLDDLMAYYKNQWAKIGVELILNPRTSAVRNSIYQKKTHIGICVQSQASDFPEMMYTARKDNIYNTAMVNDPKMDDFYTRLSVTPARSDAWWALLKESNLYQIQQVFYTYMPPANEWVFWQPWLRRYYGEHDIGPYRTGGGNWIEHVWIDKEIKKSMGY